MNTKMKSPFWTLKYITAGIDVAPSYTDEGTHP